MLCSVLHGSDKHRQKSISHLPDSQIQGHLKINSVRLWISDADTRAYSDTDFNHLKNIITIYLKKKEKKGKKEM